VERNTTDVKAAVDKLVPAMPDAVVQISSYGASAAFVRAARKAGFGGTFYNVSFVGTQALADELGKDGAGVVVSQVVPSPYQPSRQITREFLEAIKKGGDKVQANYSSMEGYLAARVFHRRPAPGAGRWQAQPRQLHRRHGIPGHPGDFRVPGVVQQLGPHGIEFCGNVDAHRRRPRQNLTPPARPGRSFSPRRACAPAPA
jgi:hypothetical protein